MILVILVLSEKSRHPNRPFSTEVVWKSTRTAGCTGYDIAPIRTAGFAHEVSANVVTMCANTGHNSGQRWASTENRTSFQTAHRGRFESFSAWAWLNIVAVIATAQFHRSTLMHVREMLGPLNISIPIAKANHHHASGVSLLVRPKRSTVH